MTRSILTRYEQAQERLIIWSAPKLRRDEPVRPPVAATATISQILAAKPVRVN